MFERGDVVQIDPNVEIIGGCLMIVFKVGTDELECGARFPQLGDDNEDGFAMVKLPFAAVVSTGGRAPFVPPAFLEMIKHATSH